MKLELRPDRKLFATSERITLVMIACAVGCILLSLLMGAIAAMYYIPEVGTLMKRSGISLVQLRPLGPPKGVTLACLRECRFPSQYSFLRRTS